MNVIAMAANAPGAPLERFEFDPGPLKSDQVEIAVEYCGICHSDLSVWHNHWGVTQYPLVPGHEVAGRIVALGSEARALTIGQRVGLGWYSASCLACRQCLGGDHNLCASNESTMLGRHGGFATRVRCQWAWATPIPDSMHLRDVGPMFCGGITVFNPIVQAGVQPTQRVGVVGIGGLGHLALQFLNKWGCEVIAFTSSDSKREEVRRLGAHRAVNSRDDAAMAALKGALDMILVTVNVNLNWNAYLEALAPRGRLHFVGVVPDPIPAPAFPLIAGQKSIAGSPLGSPAITRDMIDFSARHAIRPVVEEFPMSRANDAFKHLEAGKARYRIVLKNDLG